MKDIVIDGTYEHYKGKRYQIVGVAKHSETLEDLVVYRALYGVGELWARPKDMFLESVDIDGNIVPRFRFIKQ